MTAELWLHPGEAGWHFVSLPGDVADDIRARTAGAGRPFGTVPAQVCIGQTSWSTSLFADAERDTYLMPVRAPIRRRARVAAGDLVTMTITLAADG